MFSTEYLSVKVIVVGFKRNPDYTVVGLCRLHCICIYNYKPWLPGVWRMHICNLNVEVRGRL